MSRAPWLRDPVLAKELSGLARGWQAYAARGLYIGLFGLILWDAISSLADRERFLLGPSALAKLGETVLGPFLPLQTIVILMTAISAASDLVTKEVRSGTLGVLVSTPLSPWRMALGKWKAATLQGLTLLLCGAPILAVCSSFGALVPRQILSTVALSAGAAALGAALSLLCSSLFRTGTTALLTAAVLMAAYLLTPLIAWTGPTTGTPEFTLAAHGHLLIAFILASKTPLRPELEDAWISATAVSLGGALLLVRLAAARIATLTVRTPAPPLIVRVFESLDRFYEGLGPERLRRLRFLASRGEVWERGAILWKELRTRASGRLRNAVRIALVLLVAMAVAINVDLRHLWIPAQGATVLFWLLALSNGASLFVQEREERKWDILLATPLGSGQILGAKLLAGLVPVAPMTVTILFFWLLSLSAGVLTARELLVVAPAVLLPGALAYLVGAACSLRARSLKAAFVASLSVMLGLVAFLPWTLSGLLSPRSPLGFPHPSTRMDPLRLLQEVYDRRSLFGLRYGYGYGPSVEGMMEDVTVLAAVYLLLSAGIVAVMAARFDRVTGRS